MQTLRRASPERGVVITERWGKMFLFRPRFRSSDANQHHPLAGGIWSQNPICVRITLPRAPRFIPASVGMGLDAVKQLVIPSRCSHGSAVHRGGVNSHVRTEQRELVQCRGPQVTMRNLRRPALADSSRDVPHEGCRRVGMRYGKHRAPGLIATSRLRHGSKWPIGEERRTD
jgi:hypothetical protein